MKKNLQIHVRVSPEVRKLWDELCEKSECRTQSALFRKMVMEKSNLLNVANGKES